MFILYSYNDVMNNNVLPLWPVLATVLATGLAPALALVLAPVPALH